MKLFWKKLNKRKTKEAISGDTLGEIKHPKQAATTFTGSPKKHEVCHYRDRKLDHSRSPVIGVFLNRFLYFVQLLAEYFWINWLFTWQNLMLNSFRIPLDAQCDFLRINTCYWDSWSYVTYPRIFSTDHCCKLSVSHHLLQFALKGCIFIAFIHKITKEMRSKIFFSQRSCGTQKS